ncbi:hypothetical protein ACFYSF_22635 [Streptomyces canus]|uniref:hypothetical protein n=1 Tax=Streptomyces canus TaxID=58343 RepID=UPI0036D120CD
MPRKPGAQSKPDYKPSDATREAISAWKTSVQEEERLRKIAQAAIADDLKADPDLPVASVAASSSVPWGIGTIWKIVSEYGVPARQPNKAKKADAS